MALTLGTNCGFCASAPTTDPAGLAISCETYMFAIKHTAPEGAGLITEIGWYEASATAGVEQFDIGVYTDNSDSPGTLLSGVVRGTAKTANGGVWNKASCAIAITAGTVYWIAFQMDSAAGIVSTDRGSATGARRYISSATGLTELPATAGGGTIADGGYAIYALYSAGGGGVMPIMLAHRRRRAS